MIGKGGFGTVTEIEEKMSKDHYACKELEIHSNEDLVNCMKEIETTRELEHSALMNV